MSFLDQIPLLDGELPSSDNDLGRFAEDAALLRRPPTPPRSAIDQKLPVAPALIRAFPSPPSSDDPAPSPISSRDQKENSASHSKLQKSKKKVEFSPYHVYHAHLATPKSSSPLPPLYSTNSKYIGSLPNRSHTFGGRPEKVKPKSILKPFKLDPNALGRPTVSLEQGSISLLSPGMAMINDAKIDAPEKVATLFEGAVRSLTDDSQPSERSAKLDTYMSLIAYLRDDKIAIDSATLNDVVPQLCRFIKRDMSAVFPATSETSPGSPDSQMITQSIKLLTVFMHQPEIYFKYDEEECGAFIDMAIKILSKLSTPETPPKAVVLCILALLSQQRLGPKAMTVDRVGRLLETLDSPSFVGVSMITIRLSIYSKLLLQKRDLMVNKAPDWIKSMLSSIASANKGIRDRGLALSTQVLRNAGTERAIARATNLSLERDIKATQGVIPSSQDSQLDEPAQSGQVAKVPFIEVLIKSLCDLVPTTSPSSSDESDGIFVTSVWSNITLLSCQCGHGVAPQSLSFFNAWLSVIGKCLSSPFEAVRAAAFVKWEAFCAVVHMKSAHGMASGPTTSPVSGVSEKDWKILMKPILAFVDKGPKNTRQMKSIMRTFRAIIYYSFSPVSSAAQISAAWDFFIDGFLSKNLLHHRSVEVSAEAVRIVSALFGGVDKTIRPFKPWDEERLINCVEYKLPELPCLDPKWVRTNASKCLPVIQEVLKTAHWNNHGNSARNVVIWKDAGVEYLWKSFITSISKAGQKEVKVGPELLEAVATICNLLRSTWQSDPIALNLTAEHEDGNARESLLRFKFLTISAITGLGRACFTDKFFEMNLASGKIDAVNSLPNRIKVNQGEQSAVKSPITFICELFLHRRDKDVSAAEYRAALDEIVQSSISGLEPRRKKVALAHSCCRVLGFEPSFDSELHWDLSTSEWTEKAVIWATIANFVVESLQSSNHALNGRADNGLSVTKSDSSPVAGASSPLMDQHYVGLEWRNVTDILISGLAFTRSSDWRSLWNSLVDQVARDGGESCVLVAAIQPLATALLPAPLLKMPFASMVLEKAKFANSNISYDQTHRFLYGVPPPRKVSSQEGSFDGLFQMVNTFLLDAVSGNEDTLEQTQLVQFLASIRDFLSRTPTSSALLVLSKLSPGLGRVFKSGLTQKKARRSVIAMLIANLLQDLRKSVLQPKSDNDLWSATARLFERLPQHHSTFLIPVAALLADALSSPRRDIINGAITLWNDTFGRQESLIYPPPLLEVLQRLRTQTDISLPGIPDMDEPDLPMTPLIGYQSPSSSSDDNMGPDNRLWSSPTPGPVTPSFQARGKGKRLAHLSASPSPIPSPRTPKIQRPKRRHDDSQLVFAQIPEVEEDPVESQVLTERQKDVKERQRLTANYVPEVQYSPNLYEPRHSPLYVANARVSSPLLVSTPTKQTVEINESSEIPTLSWKDQVPIAPQETPLSSPIVVSTDQSAKSPFDRPNSFTVSQNSPLDSSIIGDIVDNSDFVNISDDFDAQDIDDGMIISSPSLPPKDRPSTTLAMHLDIPRASNDTDQITTTGPLVSPVPVAARLAPSNSFDLSNSLGVSPGESDMQETPKIMPWKAFETKQLDGPADSSDPAKPSVPKPKKPVVSKKRKRQVPKQSGVTVSALNNKYSPWPDMYHAESDVEYEKEAIVVERANPRNKAKPKFISKKAGKVAPTPRATSITIPKSTIRKTTETPRTSPRKRVRFSKEPSSTPQSPRNNQGTFLSRLRDEFKDNIPQSLKEREVSGMAATSKMRKPSTGLLPAAKSLESAKYSKQSTLSKSISNFYSPQLAHDGNEEELFYTSEDDESEKIQHAHGATADAPGAPSLLTSVSGHDFPSSDFTNGDETNMPGNSEPESYVNEPSVGIARPTNLDQSESDSSFHSAMDLDNQEDANPTYDQTRAFLHSIDVDKFDEEQKDSLSNMLLELLVAVRKPANRLFS